MSVLHVFQAAQPALLYLSPACAFSVVLVALYQGRLAELWAWTDKSSEGAKAEPSREKSE